MQVFTGKTFLLPKQQFAGNEGIMQTANVESEQNSYRCRQGIHAIKQHTSSPQANSVKTQ